MSTIFLDEARSEYSKPGALQSCIAELQHCSAPSAALSFRFEAARFRKRVGRIITKASCKVVSTSSVLKFDSSRSIRLMASPYKTQAFFKESKLSVLFDDLDPDVEVRVGPLVLGNNLLNCSLSWIHLNHL